MVEKLPLLDKLIKLLQERYGGEAQYAQKVSELGDKYGIEGLLADDTNFNALSMVSMEIIIEALEKPHYPDTGHTLIEDLDEASREFGKQEDKDANGYIKAIQNAKQKDK